MYGLNFCEFQLAWKFSFDYKFIEYYKSLRVVAMNSPAILMYFEGIFSGPCALLSC